MHAPSDIDAAKAALRQRMAARRDGLEIDDRLEWDAAIAEAVAGLDEFGGPGPLGAYWPFRSEVDPRAILEAADQRGMACALPSFDGAGEVIFRAWKPWEPVMPVGFGMLGPAEEQPAVEPAILIVPLLAFDRRGVRLGWGKGHYDRVIARLAQTGRLLTVGVAYAAQEADEPLPFAPHDRPVDIVVTEREVIRPASPT